jgi:hypothetical protein
MMIERKGAKKALPAHTCKKASGLNAKASGLNGSQSLTETESEALMVAATSN